MDNRAFVKEEQSLLLAGAAATQNTDQAAVLGSILRTGANIHDWDTNGNTCLHIVLGAARPDQPWTVQSLVELLQAGADPSQSNHAGLSAFDVACNDSKELGSFRRDILLQALVESGNDIQDERLLLNTELTASYTALHHALICGDALASTNFHLRQTLIARLANVVESRGIPAYSKLYDIAVDRVLSTYSTHDSIDADTAFNDAHNYLHRMIGVKKQVCLMLNDRLPSNTRACIEKILDTRQAGTQALQEFDWLRPVDPEDLCSSYIYTLIQQLRESDTAARQVQDLRTLMETLERAIPRSRRRRSRQLEISTSMESSVRNAENEVALNDTDMNFSRDQGPPKPPRPRSGSIVETPVGFYPGFRDEGASSRPQHKMTNNHQRYDSVVTRIEEPSRRTRSIAKTPVQFYDRESQSEESMPSLPTRRL